MDLPKTCLTVFSCPNGPAENIFEGFLAVRMDLPKTFLTAFSCPNGPAENIFEGFFAELAILNVSYVEGTTIRY